MKPERPLVLAFVVLLVIGALATGANRDLPLVRNSLVYARASEHVIEHGFDPLPVVADSRQSYDKPILYPWLSAPFVAGLGNHDGLRVTSFLTTAALLFALVHFARSFRGASERPPDAWVLWLAALGPCVVYQFWSAHPDGWFAALVVFAWSLTHRLVTRRDTDPIPRVAWLAATILAALLLKNYGLILLVSCPLYVVWNRAELRGDRRYVKRLLAGAAIALVVIGAFVASAATGHNPLSRLEGEGGGVAQYGSGELWTSARGAWLALGIALLLQFHVAAVFAMRRSAWNRRVTAALVCFGATYVLGLNPFPTTFYNMRYFVPLFALAALVCARGASSLSVPARRAILTAHAALSLALIAVFNCAPLYRACAPHLPKLEVNWIGVPLSLLDNLRMQQHLDQADILDNVNSRLPAGARLIWLDVNYYRDAQQGVFERAGRVRADISTQYASSRGFSSDASDYYVWRSSPRSMPPDLGRVEDLGHGLFHVVAETAR